MFLARTLQVNLRLIYQALELSTWIRDAHICLQIVSACRGTFMASSAVRVLLRPCGCLLRMRLVDASYLADFGSWPSRSSDVLGSSFLGYLGFLRASEFMVPNLSSYSSSLHLSVQDFAVDSSSAASSLRIRIKGSKTDPSRKGSFHSHWP